MDNCRLPYKESKLNALNKLEEKGLIVGTRILPLDKRDEFQAYHAKELRIANSAYNLSLTSLYTIESNTVGDDFKGRYEKKITERVEPIDAAFAEIDKRRKQLGIYEDQISYAEYKKKLREQNENLKEEQLLADTGTYEYQGEVYASQEDVDAARRQDQSTFFMPTTNYNPTNYGSVISFKKNVLSKIEKRLNDINSLRRTVKNSALKKEAQELQDLKDRVTEQIKNLETDPDIFDRTMQVFYKDLSFIKSLVANPTMENLDLAEYHLSYFETITDYSSQNPDNTLVDTSDYTAIEPEVKELLDKMTRTVKELKTDINQAKKEYLLEVIEQTPELKKMFSNNSTEEIRDIINAFEGDIDKVSMIFLSADLNFSGPQDILGQLIVDILKEAKYKNKAQSKDHAQKINDTEADARKALLGLGKGITYFSRIPWLGKFFSDVSYDMFYQKTARGSKTGRLIGKYSHSWFKTLNSFIGSNMKAIEKAITNQSESELNNALVNKYSWLNQNTDFVDLTRLPEIISNPAFAQYSSYFNPADADAYKQKLIATIGQYEYNRLVIQQTLLIEDFNQKISNELAAIMNANNVTSPANLPLNIIDHFNIFTKRHSPFEFMQSHNTGQEGRVDYFVGQQGNQYQSYLNYNTHIPKKEVEKYDPVSGITFTEDSGFYDKDFSQIESDPALLKFWETVSDAVEWMNSKLSDSNTSLSHNSLLAMEKSLVGDVLLNKNVGILKKFMPLLRATADTFKGLFSQNVRNTSVDQSDYISKGIIKTIEEPVNKNMKIIEMKLSTILGVSVSPKTVIDLQTAPNSVIDIFEKTIGKNRSQIMQEYGTSVPVSILREHITHQVIQEQTFNLPVMLRAYLDATSTYAAQKESLPKINILKGIYEDKVKHQPADQENSQVNQAIRNNRTKKGIENKRVNSQTRMNYWINKSVKGSEDKKYWLKLGKNYTKGEADFKKEAEIYLASLNNRLNNTTEPGEIEAIQAEIADIQNVLDNIGQFYTAAAIYDALINRWAILLGLGWNVKAQVMNRMQGVWSSLVHDTGRYWKEGNIYAANSFVNRKGLRYIPGMTTYKHEVRKVKLLVEKLGVIQDATNELDRAKGDSGLRGIAKKVNPFYLTEYVEWHNQVPQILAMLMDQSIEHPTLLDEHGNPLRIPVFNGNTQKVKLQDGSMYTIEYGLPAFNVKNGQLVLKPEMTSDSNKDVSDNNKATWENFSTEEASSITKKIDTTLALLNGDYRSDSNTVIKQAPLGRSLMGFKTWIATNIYTRFASNQSNINLGLKDFDGAYTGSLKSNKTGIAGATLMSVGIGVGVLASGGTLGLIGGGLSVIGMSGYAARQAYLRRKSMQEDSKALKQMAAAIQGIVKKSVGVPINFVSGKNIIKAHTFNELDISEKEKQNLRFLVNEATLLLTTFLSVVLVKSLFGGDDEEEESKTIDGKHPNPYYYQDQAADDDKSTLFLLENTLTDLINSGSLFYNSGELYNSTFSSASIEGWSNKIGKIGEQVIKVVFKGEEDVLETGINKGHSRIGVSISKAIVPGLITNSIFEDKEDDDEGFIKNTLDLANYGNYMEKDLKNNQIIDTWYDTDFKIDKREAKNARKEFKRERKEYWEKEFDFNNLDPISKKIVEDRITTIINKELEIQNPMPNRALYDENQKRINDGN
jgi:hypothetical protein